jgi:hypothetical protein
MMIDVGIKETVRQGGEIVDKKLTDCEGCVTFTDNEIVLCVKGGSEYSTTRTAFEADTPRLILTVATNITERMVFGQIPAQASVIVTSALPKAIVHRKKQQLFAYTS